MLLSFSRNSCAFDFFAFALYPYPYPYPCPCPTIAAYPSEYHDEYLRLLRSIQYCAVCPCFFLSSLLSSPVLRYDLSMLFLYRLWL